MNDLNKLRLVIIRELKDVRRFFDNMERNVKSRNPLAIQRAYIFLERLVYHMNEGDLTPDYIAYILELRLALQELDELEEQKKASENSLLSSDAE